MLHEYVKVAWDMVAACSDHIEAQAAMNTHTNELQ
jgi:hypothetical protein